MEESEWHVSAMEVQGMLEGDEMPIILEHQRRIMEKLEQEYEMKGIEYLTRVIWTL